MTDLIIFAHKFERKAEGFTFHHPYLVSFSLFIGIPIFTLTAVAACTVMIALPFSIAFGQDKYLYGNFMASKKDFY